MNSFVARLPQQNTSRFGSGACRCQAPPSAGFIDEVAEISFPAIRDVLVSSGFSLFGHSVGGGRSIVIAATMPDVYEQVVSESAQSVLDARTET